MRSFSAATDDRAPGMLRALREADPDYVLLDGTLAECDRVGDSRADYSHCEDGGVSFRPRLDSYSHWPLVPCV